MCRFVVAMRHMTQSPSGEAGLSTGRNLARSLSGETEPPTGRNLARGRRELAEPCTRRRNLVVQYSVKLPHRRMIIVTR